MPIKSIKDIVDTLVAEFGGRLYALERNEETLRNAIEAGVMAGWEARKLATFDARGLSTDQMRAIALSAELERLRDAVLDVLIDHQKVLPEDARNRLRKAVGRVE